MPLKPLYTVLLGLGEDVESARKSVEQQFTDFQRLSTSSFEVPLIAATEAEAKQLHGVVLLLVRRSMDTSEHSTSSKSGWIPSRFELNPGQDPSIMSLRRRHLTLGTFLSLKGGIAPRPYSSEDGTQKSEAITHTKKRDSHGITIATP